MLNKWEQRIFGVQPHVGATERNNSLSLKVWNEGLVEGVGGAREPLVWPKDIFFPCHLDKRSVGGRRQSHVWRLAFEEQQRLGTAGWGLAG